MSTYKLITNKQITNGKEIEESKLKLRRHKFAMSFKIFNRFRDMVGNASLKY